VARVALPDVPIPFNVKLEEWVLPNPDKIVKAVNNVLSYKAKTS
jgi:pyruvate/2-oxoglutarate/acetoin dehydrogenase E1 component